MKINKEDFIDNYSPDPYYAREAFKMELDTLIEQGKADAIDEFVKFIFARNVMHNEKFITREEQYFLDMANSFKEQK